MSHFLFQVNSIGGIVSNYFTLCKTANQTESRIWHIYDAHLLIERWVIHMYLYVLVGFNFFIFFSLSWAVRPFGEILVISHR